jgi:hypothetical protein
LTIASIAAAGGPAGFSLESSQTVEDFSTVPACAGLAATRLSPK